MRPVAGRVFAAIDVRRLPAGGLLEHLARRLERVHELDRLRHPGVAEVRQHFDRRERLRRAVRAGSDVRHRRRQPGLRADQCQWGDLELQRDRSDRPQQLQGTLCGDLPHRPRDPAVGDGLERHRRQVRARAADRQTAPEGHRRRLHIHQLARDLRHHRRAPGRDPADRQRVQLGAVGEQQRPGCDPARRPQPRGHLALVGQPHRPVAGGGLEGQRPHLDQHQLRLCQRLRPFLVPGQSRQRVLGLGPRLHRRHVHLPQWPVGSRAGVHLVLHLVGHRFSRSGHRAARARA